MPNLTLKCTRCEKEQTIKSSMYGYETTKFKTIQEAVTESGWALLKITGAEGYFCPKCKDIKSEIKD